MSNLFRPFPLQTLNLSQAKELGIEFVGAFDNEDHLDKPTSIPGLRNLGGDGAGGLIPKEQFELELQRSLVVIGIGSPFVSPTRKWTLAEGTRSLGAN